MNNALLTQTKLFGLYELALDGTVVFYKAGVDNEFSAKAQNLVGRNFFTEIASFENIDEFRNRFENFVEAHQSVASFTFNGSRNESQNLRVMLVRLGKGSPDERMKFVLADFRPA